MCPADDSRLTLEFADHYVIQPSIRFSDAHISYENNGLGEVGQPVHLGFEYSSGTNPYFMTIAEVAELIAPHMPKTEPREKATLKLCESV